MELQMELTRRDIPFDIRSGLRFFEQAHIKDVVSFLRIMNNVYDEVSWKRMLKLFPRIGNRTADHIYEYIKSIPDPIHAFASKSIVEHFKSIQKENIEIWSKLFNELSVLLEEEALSDMISAVLKHGYSEYLKYNYPNSDSRLEDIGQLMNFSTQYQSLEGFLSELSLLSGVSGEEIVSGIYHMVC
jgi:DNA helicase-2/ATP-dependent DNA helicase PcrA